MPRPAAGPAARSTPATRRAVRRSTPGLGEVDGTGTVGVHDVDLTLPSRDVQDAIRPLRANAAQLTLKTRQSGPAGCHGQRARVLAVHGEVGGHAAQLHLTLTGRQPGEDGRAVDRDCLARRPVHSDRVAVRVEGAPRRGGRDLDGPGGRTGRAVVFPAAGTRQEEECASGAFNISSPGRSCVHRSFRRDRIAGLFSHWRRTRRGSRSRCPSHRTRPAGRSYSPA